MIPQDKDTQTIAIGIMLAALGGFAAFLQSHEGNGLSPIEFIKALLAKLVIAAFLGTVVGLLCQSMHLGVRESCVMASMAGFFNNEALEILKEWFKKRMPQ